MQAAKRITQNTLILYVRMAVTVLISLYSTRLILSALGADDFGLFNVVGGLIAMLGFLNACMAESTQRFMSYAQGEGDENKQKTIFNVSVVLHFFIAICLFVLLEVAGYVFLNHVLNIPPERLHAANSVYQFMVVSTIFTVISVPYDSVINARENMTLFAILGIIESVLKLFIAFIIVQSSMDKLIVYGFLMAFLSVLLLLARVYYCNKMYPECAINIRSNYDKVLMKEMSTFAGWSLLGYSSSMIAFYGQGIVLNIFFGAIANAAQGIATQISGQLGALAHTLLRALNPTIAKSEGSGDRELMIKTAMFGSKISFFLLMIFYVPIIIEMKFILTLWLKNVPEFTTIFCQLLLARNLLEQLFLTFISAISAVGKIRKFQLIGSTISLFPLPITYLLFSYGYPPYTLYFVFIAYSALSSVNIIYFSSKIFNLSVPLFLKDVLLRCAGAFIIVFTISAIPLQSMQDGIGRLAVVTLLSAILFFVVVWKIGLSRNERTDITSLSQSVIAGFRNSLQKLMSNGNPLILK
jgi:O-antigen/teichoic acid export membrane protein